MVTSTTNLRVQRPSRRAQKPGDVFRVQLPDLSYRFGRVIRTDARWTRATGAGTAILIYIYRVASESPDTPDRGHLRPDQLLIPPVMTNKLPWMRGYFDTVANIPLEDHDVLPQHCFSDSAVAGRYFDEMGNTMQGPVEPVGDFGLHSFRTIDDALSDALGLARAPEGA